MESDALMWMWWAEGPVSVLHGPMTETFAHTGTLLCWPGLSANTETLQSNVCLELSGGLIKCLALNLWFPMNLHGPRVQVGFPGINTGLNVFFQEIWIHRISVWFADTHKSYVARGPYPLLELI